jgi:toxin HigB-1
LVFLSDESAKSPPAAGGPESPRKLNSLRIGDIYVVPSASARSLTLVSLDDTSRFVIRNFRDKVTEAVFNGESPKGFPADLVKVARRKLRYLNAAGDLGDLRSPPGNRLEALAGDRKGQHSIRINDQFRVCFVWTADGPAEVEIVDYH